MSEAIRKTKIGVTVFPYVLIEGVEHYLLLLRNPDKVIDPNCINGPGGKLERNTEERNIKIETIIAATLRELAEETGQEINQEDLVRCGTICFFEGYPDDWVTTFFKVMLEKDIFEKIKDGTRVADGVLYWVPGQEVLQRPDLVPDLYHIWPFVLDTRNIFEATMFMGTNGATIEHYVIDSIPR